MLADEVGCSLHTILLYEIEGDLAEGHLAAAEVPRLWNNKMKEYMAVLMPQRDDVVSKCICTGYINPILAKAEAIWGIWASFSRGVRC
ncbi:Carboxypeptidase Taq (M32) metallopeptidase, putative [Leishmania guyanensis]|uniref:Carboxypeptidase Taq (M32) metallopeptidase n=2 Tax=Leishmania guyanensis species complex TaxID=38579 RepID=A0AAW3B462_9TRYP|nr:carboxypeptidase, putative,metallo-peptidase,Clan MA(E), Family M32 [Leishmania guyanensis]